MSRRLRFGGASVLLLAACTDGIGPPGAAKLGFTVEPSNATAGAPISPAVAVAIEDASGHTVTSASSVVTVTIVTTPGGGTLAGTPNVAAVNGVATFSNLHVDKAGAGYTLTASASGLTGMTSAPFDITPAATTSPIIAFQSNRGIEAIAPDGSGRVVLIADSTAFQPAWSPDGARLAFARNTCEIYTARADGSGMQQITTPLTQPWCAYSPAWSPDGTKIAFTAGEGRCVDGMYCETGSIYVVNADGSNETQLLTRGSLPPLTERFSNFRWVGLSFPKWSPDGSMIAFTCDATNGGDDLWWVCIGAADGSSVTRLPDLVAESPAWSPDGSEIASSSDSAQGIILRNADGSGVATILTTPGTPCPCSFEDYDPAWSPDGTQLVFARATGDRFFPPFTADLFIINRDGTGLRRLTTTNDASRPTWRSATPLPLP